MPVNVTRRDRSRVGVDREPSTQRVLTGGEIEQVRREEMAKAYGWPEDPPPEPPMRKASDMATREEVRRRIDADIARSKKAAGGVIG